jgi:hypothetical protein
VKRLDQRGQWVLDEGDFYKAETSQGLHYTHFVGERGQSNPLKVHLECFGVGEVDFGENDCDRYSAVFDTFEAAQADFVSRSQQETSEEVELCARCERRPPTKGDFCNSCAAMMEGVSK